MCLCLNGEFAISCQGNDVFVFILNLNYSNFTLTEAKTYLSTTARMVANRGPLSNMCNPLQLESCMNGGQCLPTVDGYRCRCASGFTGRVCDISMFSN